jgi:hypothetical protein
MLMDVPLRSGALQRAQLRICLPDVAQQRGHVCTLKPVEPVVPVVPVVPIIG